MFRAIARCLRAVGYLLIGRIDAAPAATTTSPDPVGAAFDRILEEKKRRIQQYKDAMAGMIVQNERKEAELKRQSEEVARLETLRAAAAALARKVVDRHGGNIEAVKNDPDYLKSRTAYSDFSSTLHEMGARIAALEEDVKGLHNTLQGHKVQLQLLLSDLEQIGQEKHETLADLITACEERELADLLAGISEHRIAKDLEKMRDLRDNARARSRVLRDLAGLDVPPAEEELLDRAPRIQSDTDFDRLIGGMTGQDDDA